MGIFDLLKHNQIQGVEVLKDIDYKEVETLENLSNKVSDEQKSFLESQINKLKFGLEGEQRIMYELKHLKTNALVIHNLTLFDKNGEQSQIDFVVLTARAAFIIESKSLTGNININSDGEFKRQFINSLGKVYKTEGIYSPVRQNEIHIDVLCDFISSNKLVKNYPLESIVVISNSKTIINKNYAPKNIKDLIVKYDSLDNKILKLMSEHSDIDISDSKLNSLAESLIKNDTPRVIDYVSAYKLKLVDEEIQKETEDALKEGFVDEDTAKKISDDSLLNELKEYRLTKSRELKWEPYMVFSNKLMEDIILKMPKCKAELIEIQGFGQKKYEMFGLDILKIINGDFFEDEESLTQVTTEDKNIEDCDGLIKELKSFRMNKARELDYKPYFIFTDKQMNDLVLKKVTTKEEFISIPGFGEKKYELYGNEILDIIKKYLCE